MLPLKTSHAASFALLVYVSSWLKRHEPAAFAAALLNSQPLGFYSTSAIVQDARRHGVELRPSDVMHSDVDSTLETAPSARRSGERASPQPSEDLSAREAGNAQPALRLGLGLVKGLKRQAAERLVEARRERPFASIEDLARRAALDRADLSALAAADALASLAGHRRAALWETLAVDEATRLALPAAAVAAPPLAVPTESEEIVGDYAALGLTLRRHPLALLRERLRKRGIRDAAEVAAARNGQRVRAAGIVTCRQRPATASGVIFVTLEDETGYVNLVVWNDLAERQRRELLGARLLEVTGEVQKQGLVVHILARRFADLTPLLGRLATPSHDFH